MTFKDAVKCQPIAQAQGWHHHWYVPVRARVDEALFSLILTQLETPCDGQTIA